MNSIQQDLDGFKNQLEKGSLQRAYRALIAYMSALRTLFAKKYGDSAVSALYQGFMDMTYFAIFTPALKARDLKIAIVFNYDPFRFEVWLAARNRKVQRQVWELFKDSALEGVRIVEPAEGIDSIVECDLAQGFDLASPDKLTSKIEAATADFIARMEKFLAEHPSTAG
jgi:hypothetical protein